MFSHFTQEAVKAISRAQEQAVYLNDNWIGSEHILLALVVIESKVSSLFESNGLSENVVRSEIAETKQSLEQEQHKSLIWKFVDKIIPSFRNALPFTPSAVKLVEECSVLEVELGLDFIDERIIALALLRLDCGLACRILRKQNIAVGTLELQLRNLS
jgi:ATP-dependent Clp protease ATP-binding subunit ClpC